MQKMYTQTNMTTTVCLQGSAHRGITIFELSLYENELKNEILALLKVL